VRLHALRDVGREQKAEHANLLSIMRTLRDEPTAIALARLGQQATLIGAKLGKPVSIQVEDDGTRLPPDRTRAFFVSLVHVIRNAIDHGLEPPEARAAAGKPAIAVLRLGAKMEGKALVVTVADDGRGVDWEEVRARATSLGLAHDTNQDLEEALFADGFSTKVGVTELSGRGVGLPAVRRATEQLGGHMEIRSRKGEGTEVRFVLPM
jgi:two-component system chemotaxis sensor kinase CheA